MPANETLKEYLVKIGWNVDMKGFKIAGSITDKLKEKLTANAGEMGKAFITASSQIVEAIDEVSSWMTRLIFKTADADLAIEKLDRRFYAAEQNVRSYRYALDALGENEDDLFYMTDEQYNRFIQLNSLGKRLEAPKELDDYLVKVRDLQFEFSKIKMFLDYGRRWIVYWLGRMQEPQFIKLTNFFKRLTTFIEKNLPKITFGIAKFFDIFIRLGTAAFTIAKSIFGIFTSIDPAILKIGASLIGLFAIIKSGPIGWLIMSILFLLALIDDYLTWKRGGDSLFDWTKTDEALQGLISTWEDLNAVVSDLLKVFQPLFDLVKDIFGEIDGKQIIIDAITTALNLLKIPLVAIKHTLEFIKSFVDLADKGKMQLDKTLKNVLGEENYVKVFGSEDKESKDKSMFSEVLSSLFWSSPVGWSLRSTGMLSALMNYLTQDRTVELGNFGGSRNSSYNQTFNTNVYGSSDPQETADAVVDAIGRNRNSWVPVGG